MKQRRTLTVRTRLLGALLLVAIPVVVAFDLTTVTAIRGWQMRRIDAVLNEIVTNHQYRTAELPRMAEQTAKPAMESDPIPQDYSVLVVTNDGRVFVVSSPPDTSPTLPADLADAARTGGFRTVRGSDGSTFRLRTAATDVGVLVAVANLRSVTETTH
jgi:hypothetical protein